MSVVSATDEYIRWKEEKRMKREEWNKKVLEKIKATETWKELKATYEIDIYGDGLMEKPTGKETVNPTDHGTLWSFLFEQGIEEIKDWLCDKIIENFKDDIEVMVAKGETFDVDKETNSLINALWDDLKHLVEEKKEEEAKS